MIACYLRVSTGWQKADSQRADIERWLTGHGIGVDDVTWYEDAESGTILLASELSTRAI